MSNGSILIANPCDAERTLLSHALQHAGLSVITAASAKEAVEAVHSQGVALVILDTLGWGTPAMNALAILKSNAATRRVPVLIFGQPQQKEEVIDAMRRGANTWIGRKGFEIGKFVDKLKSLIEKVPSSPEPLAHPVPGSAVLEVAPADLERITPEVLKAALAGHERLPAFEFSITDAVTATGAKTHILDLLASVATRDPMLATGLLALANLPERHQQHGDVTDTTEAMSVIGPTEFYRLAELTEPIPVASANLWDAGCYWLHSVATARIAGMLSRRLHLRAPAEAISAGLLHDLGYFVLAHFFPRHYGALLSAGADSDSINLMWEKNLIGAHHGEISAWTMGHFGLPATLRDAALVHHTPGTIGQTLSTSSRVVAMIVQAADRLADALLPADAPLSTLANPHEEFKAAADGADLSARSIIDECRKIIAELLTEMIYLFPQSANRAYLYKREPLEEVAYFGPRAGDLDVIRTFFEVRSRRCPIVNRIQVGAAPPGVPLVVNLTNVPDIGAQIEILTSLLAAHMADKRRGIVLLPGAINRMFESLFTSEWRLVALPGHPSSFMRFLAGPRAEVAVEVDTCAV